METAAFTSPADGSEQKTLFYAPPGDEPVPLLVAFHTWSGDYRQDESPYAEWCIARGWAFVHPDVVRDLENLTGFISAERYASTGPVHEAEVGAVKNVRFLMTTNLPTVDAAGNPAASTTWVAGATNTTKAVVYPTIIIAKDAYGTVGIDKGTVKSIVKVPGSQSTNDPLNMLTTAGWKTWFTAKILNDAWVCRIESLATA